MAGNARVLLVSRLGAVFGVGISAREADRDALALMGRTLEHDAEMTLDAVVEDLRGASHVTVSGPHADVFLCASGLGLGRPSRRGKVAQGAQ